MPPHESVVATGVLYEGETVDAVVVEQEKTHRMQIIWPITIALIYLHISGVYGYYLGFTACKLSTFIFIHIYGYLTGFGITAGVHKLWSHRSFKAKWPLRVLLMLCNTAVHQNCIYNWSRYHRVHHKYSETKADPYNAKRGFFFSHVGWLMVKKDPAVKEMADKVDVSDLAADWVVMFQKKYYYYMMPLFTFIIPAIIPIYFFEESVWNAYHFGIARYIIQLNSTWLINSAAHKFGNKSFDKSIQATNNLITSYFALGEGWHNYHHVFPWDCKTPNLGYYNPTNNFIELFAKIGQAYDLKTVPKSLVKKRMDRTGDGSLEVWGWPDKDLSQEVRDEARILYKKHRM